MSGAFFVVGPTSVGKSRFAMELAQCAGGEIVNADAFQVYDGLTILTSQPSAEECVQVPHHLFGFVPPTEPFDVAKYLTQAQGCLQEIRHRGRLAVVVGGTGLYVKALTHGLSPLPAADPLLRAELEVTSLDELVRKLVENDPSAAHQVDLKNKRRVVRALEVFLVTGKPFTSYRDAWEQTDYQPGGAGVLLERTREDLLARIDHQVEQMFRAGVVEEVRALRGDTIGKTAAGAIGLAEIIAMTKGRLALAECKEKIKIRTRQYAKRQVTWFKKEQVFRLLSLTGEDHQIAREAALLAERLRHQTDVHP